MKKLAIAMMLGIAAMSASAQVNYKMQVACSPQDVKTYDTNRLRSSFLMEKVMVPNEINVTYSMYDRLIFGGAVPATKELVLETIDPLKSKFFLERRELGVINIGGEGIVTVDGKEYTLKFKDALYAVSYTHLSHPDASGCGWLRRFLSAARRFRWASLQWYAH